jgi:hypothetical protein
MKRRHLSNGKSPPVRKRTTVSLACLRSAVSNGSSLFLDKSIDQRGAWARRLRDLISDHVSDLGGEDMVSSAEMALVRRCAMLTLQLELLEQRFANSENGEATPKALDAYQRTVGALRRTLESLGLQRRQKDVTTLSDYLANREAAE